MTLGGRFSFTDIPSKGDNTNLNHKTRRSSAPFAPSCEAPASPTRRMSGEFTTDTQPIAIEKYVYLHKSPSGKLERHAETTRRGKLFVGSTNVSSDSGGTTSSDSAPSANDSSRSSSSSSPHKSRRRKSKHRGGSRRFWISCPKDYVSLKFEAPARLYGNPIWEHRG